ncbi:hypothetical protein RYX36_019358, partial [Vicia faba]
DQPFPENVVPQKNVLGEMVNQLAGGLEPGVFWEKKITKSMKGVSVIRRCLLPYQMEHTLMDLDTMDYYDCEIMKSLSSDRSIMYICYGRYQYAKEKNLKEGDTLLFHYHS